MKITKHLEEVMKNYHPERNLKVIIYPELSIENQKILQSVHDLNSQELQSLKCSLTPLKEYLDKIHTKYNQDSDNFYLKLSINQSQIKSLSTNPLVKMLDSLS